MPPETSKQTPLRESNKAGHSSGYFGELANMSEEEKEHEVRPPPQQLRGAVVTYCILGAASINMGADLPQLRPLSSPVSGASPRQLPEPPSLFGVSAATYFTTVLRLQHVVVDLRLWSEGTHVSELTMQRIGKLTRNSSSHSQRLYRSRHLRSMLSRTLTGLMVFNLGISGITREFQV